MRREKFGGETAQLGELIEVVKRLPADGEVVFDFCSFSPVSIGSWRGRYAELALGYKQYAYTKRDELLKILKSAVGNTYQGYKGGWFLMDHSTQVWVDNYSEYTSTAIFGYEMNDSRLTLLTKSR